MGGENVTRLRLDGRHRAHWAGVPHGESRRLVGSAPWEHLGPASPLQWHGCWLRLLASASPENPARREPGEGPASA